MSRLEAVMNRVPLGVFAVWRQSLILGAFGHVGGVRVVWLLANIILVIGFQ